MLNIKKEIGIGILVALICTLGGIYLYVTLFTNYDINVALQYAYQDKFLGEVIGLGAVANFLPFFVYLKRNEIYRARGVLIFCIFLALIVLFLKANELFLIFSN